MNYSNVYVCMCIGSLNSNIDTISWYPYLCLINIYIYKINICRSFYIYIYLYTSIFIYNANARTLLYLVKHPSSWGTNIGAARELCANFRRGHCNRLLDPSFWKICQTPTSRERWEGWMFGGIQFFLNFISEILQHIAFVSAICFAETSRCLGCTTLVIVSFGVIFEWIPCWTVGSNDFVWDTIRFAEDADQTCNFWGNSYSHSAVCVWQIE